MTFFALKQYRILYIENLTSNAKCQCQTFKEHIADYLILHTFLKYEIKIGVSVKFEI